MASPVVAPPRRRRSMTGPFILIFVGVIFLLGNLHLISWGRLGVWFAHYWPVLLILWGAVKLVEHYRAKQEGLAASGIGAGGVFLLIFLIVAGLTASQIVRVNWNDLRDHVDIGDNDIPFFGRTFDFEDQPSLTQALPSGGSVKIVNDRGAVNVSVSNDDQIRVTYEKKIRAENQEEANKWNEQTKPQISVSGNLVTINANTRGAGEHTVIADLNVAIPRKAPLTISSQRGDVNVMGRDGAVEISSQRGEVNVDDVNGDVTLNMDRSSVRGSQISGDVMIAGRSNNVTLTDVKGAAHLSGEFMESVKLSKIGKSVKFNSSRTDMEFARLEGDLDLDSGDLRASGLTGPIRLTTRSKDVTLEGVSGDVRVQDENSPVEIRLKSAGNVQVDNRHGDITVGVPEKIGFKVDARTRGGEVQVDFPDLKVSNDDNQGTATGTVGNGAIRLVLNSEHGTIAIRKGSIEVPAEAAAPPKPPKPPKVPGRGAPSEPTEN
ncbi:MAG TPA: DUF4097 family beta strand repeat-containing protein [Terriglobales bacterium]|nr:DUF4097 family beta strand repeat-containing protein [Terriglobales bacterium]